MLTGRITTPSDEPAGKFGATIREVNVAAAVRAGSPQAHKS